MNKISVGILGASGFAGGVLRELVRGHPSLRLAFAASRLGGVADDGDTLVAAEDAPLGEAALVFTALPHGVSEGWVRRAAQAGAAVVDLSSDLRPGSARAGAPYGITELARDAVRGASIVANPGCYPTSIVLALAPLLRRGLVAPEGTISVAAASGVTGAGASPKRELLFAEVSGDYRAYAVGNDHRHLPELRAALDGYGATADLVFIPHLLPVARGILSTITVPLVTALAAPSALWREDYAGEPFVEVADRPPRLRDVVARNVVRIFVTAAAGVRRPTLTIVSAIDNLLKGAAGQAVQNANLMLGLAETAGLPR